MNGTLLYSRIKTMELMAERPVRVEYYVGPWREDEEDSEGVLEASARIDFVQKEYGSALALKLQKNKLPVVEVLFVKDGIPVVARNADGTQERVSCDWRLAALYNRASSEPIAEPEERAAFRKLGNRLMCSLLHRMKAIGQLRDSDVVVLEASGNLPPETKMSMALVDYYRRLGFSVWSSSPKDVEFQIGVNDVPMWAEASDLLQNCRSNGMGSKLLELSSSVLRKGKRAGQEDAPPTQKRTRQ